MATSASDPAHPVYGNYASDLCILVFGTPAAVLATVGVVAGGAEIPWASVVLPWGLFALAAALLAVRYGFERRAGLRVGVDERFRWVDDPAAGSAHEARVARRLPRWARALRPLAYGLLAVAWWLWIVG